MNKLEGSSASSCHSSVGLGAWICRPVREYLYMPRRRLLSWVFRRERDGRYYIHTRCLGSTKQTEYITSLILNPHRENPPHHNNRIHIRARYGYPLALFGLGDVLLKNERHRRFVLDRLLGNQRSENLGGVRRVIGTETCLWDEGFGCGFGSSKSGLLRSSSKVQGWDRSDSVYCLA